jgi:hypothetical protein
MKPAKHLILAWQKMQPPYDLQFSGSGLTTFTKNDVQIGPYGNFAIRGGMKPHGGFL